MKRNEGKFALFLALLAMLAWGPDLSAGQLPQADKFFKKGMLRALIFSGRCNHDWRSTTPFLRRLLEASGRFDVRVAEETSGLTEAVLQPYDLLVLDYGGPRWGKPTEQAVERFVRGGKGMLVVHGSSYNFSGLEVLADGHAGTGLKEAPWPEFAKMVGGYWPARPAQAFHGQRHSFRVKLLQREDAVLQGLPENFWATDELYHGMTFLPGTRILAAAFDDPAMGGTGKEEPMLTRREYGKGRVFYTALGHELPAMQEQGFQVTLARGAEWAASGKVTIPADFQLRPRKPDALRLLVITGGHDYETSFYTLFEGQPDLRWQHAATAEEAFSRDQRGNFDVLVFYDMTKSLSEATQKRLQQFAESGKGIVALHHTIGGHQQWRWWGDELIGGRYLLQPEGHLPASTYKHDQEMFVQPAGRHPIVDSIGAMHLMDETYKGMWISPRNKVLLTTGHPDSDKPLAWISPYAQSRVVYIQLGHDSAAHLHPAYRQLVRQAILWAGGRLK